MKWQGGGVGVGEAGRRDRASASQQDKELGHLPQIPQQIHSSVAACLSGRRQLTENPPELSLGCCQLGGGHP